MSQGIEYCFLFVFSPFKWARDINFSIENMCTLLYSHCFSFAQLLNDRQVNSPHAAPIPAEPIHISVPACLGKFLISPASLHSSGSSLCGFFSLDSWRNTLISILFVFHWRRKTRLWEYEMGFWNSRCFMLNRDSVWVSDRNDKNTGSESNGNGANFEADELWRMRKQWTQNNQLTLWKLIVWGKKNTGLFIIYLNDVSDIYPMDQRANSCQLAGSQ